MSVPAFGYVHVSVMDGWKVSVLPLCVCTNVWLCTCFCHGWVEGKRVAVVCLYQRLAMYMLLSWMGGR